MALWRKKSQLTKRALRRKKNYNWQKKEKKISTTWQQLCYFVTVSSNQIIWEQHAQCQEPRSYFLLELVKCIKCFHGCVAQCCQQVVTLPYSVKIFAKFRCFILIAGFQPFPFKPGMSNFTFSFFSLQLQLYLFVLDCWYKFLKSMQDETIASPRSFNFTSKSLLQSEGSSLYQQQLYCWN